MTTPNLSQLKNQSLIKQSSFVNGSWLSSNNSFDVVNPFNNESLLQVDDIEITNDVISAQYLNSTC